MIGTGIASKLLQSILARCRQQCIMNDEVVLAEQKNVEGRPQNRHLVRSLPAHSAQQPAVGLPPAKTPQPHFKSPGLGYEGTTGFVGHGLHFGGSLRKIPHSSPSRFLFIVSGYYGNGPIVMSAMNHPTWAAPACRLRRCLPLKHGYVTFGCFHNPKKNRSTPQVIAVLGQYSCRPVTEQATVSVGKYNGNMKKK